MEITAKLRKKFVKDCKLPIKIYEEPYFSYQMNLFNEHYDCLAKYKCFKDSIKDFSTEEEYFSYYNKIKDTVMNTIKTNPYFIEFNERNMTDWTNYITNISHYGFTSGGKYEAVVPRMTEVSSKEAAGIMSFTRK